jgi:serine/threonine protein kinase
MSDGPSKRPERLNPPSDPAPQSAVRSAGRATLPHGGVAAGAPDAREADATVKVDAFDMEDWGEIDPAEFERVTLVDLPSIARYGRYELLGRIAYGGMAEIFLAREGNTNAQRLLVIKRVLPHVAEDQHFVDMFVDEARLAMQLNHPSICHVYSFGEEDGTWYIAMEWVNGKPLSKIIRRARETGGLPVPVALKIIAQVAEALDYAHRACDAAGEPLGIVHRDVSPQNIMVSYDGVVKLLDFGIAKATSHSTRTEAGVIKGKFAYMSPQQCIGDVIDGRADIFALGVCMFEALTGKNPFRRKTEFETMSLIVGHDTPSARERRPDLTEEIDEILQRAMMKQPERRYQTAGDMQLAIETVLPKLGVPMNASRVGEYIQKLFPHEVKDGPDLDMRVSLPPKRATEVSGEIDLSNARPPSPGSTSLDALPIIVPATPAPKRSGIGPMALAGIGVLVFLLAGAGGLGAWLMFGGAPDPAPPVARAPEPPPDVEPAGIVAAEPREEAAPQMGSVYVDSVPSGASIQLGDRENAGTTPLEIGMVRAGSYAVTLRREGYEEWVGVVSVAANERSTITAPLVAVRRDRPQPAGGPPGQLSLNTRPWSKVYLGSRLLGTTPIRVSVPSGTQRLRLVDRDGNEHRRSVRIPAGGQANESFDLSAP